VTLPTTMHGVYRTRHAGPEALAWRTDIPVPRPGAGEVRPRIAVTYPLRDIARAQAEFQAKTHPGKLILSPPETDR